MTPNDDASGFTPEQAKFLRALISDAQAHQRAEWLDEVAAAEHLKISPRMLQDGRRDGTGPVFHKAGGRLVRYRLSDLDAFMVAQGEAR